MALNTDALFRLDGLVAVITGGGSGLGLDIAHALASAGARQVFLLGRRAAVLDAAAATHPALTAVPCDVGSKESLAAAAAAVAAQTPHVNLLVANAGLFGPAATVDPAWDLATLQRTLWADGSADDFAAPFRVNVAGVHFSVLAFLPLLARGNEAARAGGFGAPATGEGEAQAQASPRVPAVQSQIVVLGSVSAFMRTPASPFAYAPSKLAATQLGKLWASRLAPFGIRCNVVAPGLFPSEMATPLLAGRDPASESPDDPSFIPARRFGGVEELGGSFIYLASRAGAYANGCVLLIDGGRASVCPATY